MSPMTTDRFPIDAEGLVRHFGDIMAVDGVDLRSSTGEIFGFLGPNGAGKTTIVRMLTTLLRPTAGQRRVAGFDVVREADTVRRSIGVALQDAAIDPLMTGHELVRLQAVLHGIAEAQTAKRRGDELLERVGLTGAADRRVGTYSGGMRRRLDLALSLVHEPTVLFLDEPTTGLDPTSRIALWDEVRRLNDERHHGVPHHAVPRGGRPARRPHRDHRSRPHRARRRARRAQGSGRRADARDRRATDADRDQAARRARPLRRRAGRRGRHARDRPRRRRRRR